LEGLKADFSGWPLDLTAALLHLSSASLHHPTAATLDHAASLHHSSPLDDSTASSLNVKDGASDMTDVQKSKGAEQKSLPSAHRHELASSSLDFVLDCGLPVLSWPWLFCLGAI
jgi:hypothetical protein